MQPETARWLNESRGSFGAAQRRFNDISSMDVTGAGALFLSAEYAVKAVIASTTVSYPRPLRPTGSSTSRIGSGLWPQFPPDLRAYLADIAPLDPNVLYPRETRPRDPPRTYETSVSSSSNAEWQQRLTTAPRFIQYIERDVIGNSATFGKLTF